MTKPPVQADGHLPSYAGGSSDSSVDTLKDLFESLVNVIRNLSSVLIVSDSDRHREAEQVVRNKTSGDKFDHALWEEWGHNLEISKAFADVADPPANIDILVAILDGSWTGPTIPAIVPDLGRLLRVGKDESRLAPTGLADIARVTHFESLNVGTVIHGVGDQVAVVCGDNGKLFGYEG